MNDTKPTTITVETQINAPIDKVWKMWNDPKDIVQWNHASSDWHAPRSSNDLRVGGKFNTTMAAKDGSVSFDFIGEYTAVQPNQFIAYKIADGRQVHIKFSNEGAQTKVVESFEAETKHPLDIQRDGWQAILDNFRKHVESKD